MSYSFEDDSKKRMIIVAVVASLVVLGALIYLFKFKSPETTGKVVSTPTTLKTGETPGSSNFKLNANNASRPDDVVSKSSNFRLEHTFGEVSPPSQTN